MKLMKRLAELKTEKENLANEVRRTPAAVSTWLQLLRSGVACRWSKRRSS